MTDKLTKDGNPIDKTSQRILQHLNSLRGEDVPSATSTELRDACGIDNSQTITYRVNTHLGPAGLVEWVEEDTTGAAGSRRHYHITNEGAEWASDHADDLARPSDLDDTADTAQDALSVAQDAFAEAEKAKDSVQNYRQKVARLKTRVTGREDPDYDGYWDEEGHEQRIEYLEESVGRLSEQVVSKAPGEQAASNEGRSKDNEKAIANLQDNLNAIRERIDGQPEQDDLDAIHDRLDDLDSHVDELASQVTNLESNQREFSDWSHSIDARLKEIEERQSQSLLSRLLPF